MEFRLERSPDTAMVAELPVAVWHIMGGDGMRLGLALIAEIVAVPPVDVLTAQQTRRMLAMELAEPAASITVQATDKIVEANGAPARLWLGRTAKGLVIGAFICAVAASDPDLQSLLDDALLNLNPRMVLDNLAVPESDVTRLLDAGLALR
jgi:hypothetical protein